MIRFALLLGISLMAAAWVPAATPSLIPSPKQVTWGDGVLELGGMQFGIDARIGGADIDLLMTVMQEAGLPTRDGISGPRIELGFAEFAFPEIDSRYASEIRQQAYRLRIDDEGIRIDATGTFGPGHSYGIQTLRQLIRDGKAPHVEIIDWPDLPLRMLMIDPARQNENMFYYRRVIEFAARYKINAILCHLTDDQTSALWHEDYEPIMHAHAWRPDEVRELVDLARRHHIQLIPEIESLGHSRLFTRMPDFADYLHQTESATPDQSWMGTNIPGITNVLCPASDKAMAYLETMFELSAELFPRFPTPWLHIGFDEVDMTHCNRCLEAFGEQTHDEWLATALERVSAIATRHRRTTALWGDMLIAHPAVADGIAGSNMIIFDWYYRPDVTDKSVKFFLERDLEVVACPALVAAPHMIMPNRRNYDNIARFTDIAREHDLRGINTTIWVPTRYMSDVLWTGMGFAAEHAWNGAAFDEEVFFDAFTRDFHGSDEGAAYRAAWNRLVDILWHRDDFNTSLWMDDASLAAARTMATRRRDEVAGYIAELDDILAELRRIGTTVQTRRTCWRTLERSTEILQFTMQRLLASNEVGTDGFDLPALDARTRQMIAYVEEDWDRNRFADDPGMDGLYLQTQHLLYRLKQASSYHGELMAGETTTPAP